MIIEYPKKLEESGLLSFQGYSISLPSEKMKKLTYQGVKKYFSTW